MILRRAACPVALLFPVRQSGTRMACCRYRAAIPEKPQIRSLRLTMSVEMALPVRQQNNHIARLATAQTLALLADGMKARKA